MSSVTVSWPSSRAAWNASDPDAEQPTFEQPEYFLRTHGKGGWFCSACTPSHDARVHSFNATTAMKHETSEGHKNTVARLTSWEPATVDNWGGVVGWGVTAGNWDEVREPLRRLRYSDLSREDPLKKRVTRWIRDIARADGIEIEEEQDDEPQSHLSDWGAPEDWTAGADWERPPEQWGVSPATEPSDKAAIDPRPAADFKFVEKVARARGLTKDRRRLHAFYRLSTEEKVNRIQEIVHFISTH